MYRQHHTETYADASSAAAAMHPLSGLPLDSQHCSFDCRIKRSALQGTALKVSGWLLLLQVQAHTRPQERHLGHHQEEARWHCREAMSCSSTT
jgi:hypothetical protein